MARRKQREGIDAAKAKGKHLGRPKIDLPEEYKVVIDKWRKKEITARHAMKVLGISKSSFYRLIRY